MSIGEFSNSFNTNFWALINEILKIERKRILRVEISLKVFKLTVSERDKML